MKTIKHPYISVPHGTRPKLAKDFNVSITTVSLALNYQTQGGLSEDIRQAALRNYQGIRVKPQ